MGERKISLKLLASSKRVSMKSRVVFGSIQEGLRPKLNGSFLGLQCVLTKCFPPLFWLNNFMLQPNLPIALMRLKLHTGYKHQLRFHLANCLKGLSTFVCWTLRHSTCRLVPVIGDDLYKSNDLRDVVRHSITLPSKLMFLHAHELSLEVWKFPLVFCVNDIY